MTSGSSLILNFLLLIQYITAQKFVTSIEIQPCLDDGSGTSDATWVTITANGSTCKTENLILEGGLYPGKWREFYGMGTCFALDLENEKSIAAGIKSSGSCIASIGVIIGNQMAASYKCDFDVDLDGQVETRPCKLMDGVSRLWLVVSDEEGSGTDSDVSVEFSSKSGECKSSVLDNVGNDLERGTMNMFRQDLFPDCIFSKFKAHPCVRGIPCFNMKFTNHGYDQIAVRSIEVALSNEGKVQVFYCKHPDNFRPSFYSVRSTVPLVCSLRQKRRSAFRCLTFNEQFMPQTCNDGKCCVSTNITLLQNYSKKRIYDVDFDCRINPANEFFIYGNAIRDRDCFEKSKFVDMHGNKLNCSLSFESQSMPRIAFNCT